MRVIKRMTFSRPVLLTVALAAALLMALSYGVTTPASADDVARMSLGASGAGVVCTGGECYVAPGSDFTLEVRVDAAPGAGRFGAAAGYILVQSYVDYGTDLTYTPTEASADEVMWPDLASASVAIRNQDGPGLVGHGGLTGIIAPLPVSNYLGVVFALAFTCTDNVSSNNVQLLPSGDAVAATAGTLFSLEDGQQVIPKVSSLTLHCDDAPPTPTQEPLVVLPPTGSGALDSDGGGMSALLWLVVSALVVTGSAAIGASGWRAVQRRQVQ